MNIVYALSGEGRGHASTARAILPVLEDAGHRIKVVTYGLSLGRLGDHDVMPIRGIRQRYDRSGRMSLIRSFAGNTGVLAYYATHWRSVRRELAAFGPDLFIVNFEPFSHVLARSLRVPVISFDNQHAVVFLKQPAPPGFRSSALITKTASQVVTAGADAYVVMSFLGQSHFPRRVHAVHPVIQSEFRGLRPEIGRHVLVYLKVPNPRLLEILRRMKQSFMVYGYNVESTDGNLTFRADNDGMPRDLASSRAVIATSGYSLITECAWLKKPFFGVPMRNEYEQTSNAFFLKDAGFGDFSETPSQAELEGFLWRLDDYRAALAEFQFDPDAAGRTLLELAETCRAPAPISRAVPRPALT